jgi:hypothetical protein
VVVRVLEESGQPLAGGDVEHLSRPAHLVKHALVPRIFTVLDRLESAHALADRQGFIGDQSAHLSAEQLGGELTRTVTPACRRAELSREFLCLVGEEMGMGVWVVGVVHCEVCLVLFGSDEHAGALLIYTRLPAVKFN